MNSRDKGKRGERSWAKYLREVYGLRARRTAQYCGADGTADVTGIPGAYCEVKSLRQQPRLHEVMDKAVDQCGDLVPYIAHRVSYKTNTGKTISKGWLITIQASDMVDFAEAVLDAIERRQDERTDGFLSD